MSTSCAGGTVSFSSVRPIDEAQRVLDRLRIKPCLLGLRERLNHRTEGPRLPPASNACAGRITSIATRPASLADSSSAMTCAIGWSTHCARWRCASRTSGPCAAQHHPPAPTTEAMPQHLKVHVLTFREGNHLAAQRRVLVNLYQRRLQRMQQASGELGAAKGRLPSPRRARVRGKPEMQHFGGKGGFRAPAANLGPTGDRRAGCSRACSSPNR